MSDCDEAFIEELNAIFVPDTSGYNFHKGQEPVICRYNGAVDCKDRGRCHKCGWNPQVARQRSYKIRKALSEQD